MLVLVAHDRCWQLLARRVQNSRPILRKCAGSACPPEAKGLWCSPDTDESAIARTRNQNLKVRKPRPIVYSLAEAIITRADTSAYIKYKDPDYGETTLTMGPKVQRLADQEIVDLYNDTLRAEAEHARNFNYVAVEPPLGSPQITFHALSDQWTPRGDVLDALLLMPTTDTAFRSWWEGYKIEEMSVREFMEWVISEKNHAKPGYLITPLLDVRCVGLKGFWSAAQRLTESDLGQRCNAEWRRRLLRLRKCSRIVGVQRTWSKPCEPPPG